MPITIVVVAAVIVEQHRVLVTQRPRGSHLAGMWEFPGGKLEPNEDPRDALVRELREELGIETIVEDVFDVAFHRYEERSVLLIFYRTRRKSSSPEPTCAGVAAIAWRNPQELNQEQFPPPDAGVLNRVRQLLTQGT